MKLAISVLLAKLDCLSLEAKLSVVNLLNSEVVRYLYSLLYSYSIIPSIKLTIILTRSLLIHNIIYLYYYLYIIIYIYLDQ